MNGIYIYYYYIDEKKTNGIDKKILNQIHLFNELGLNCKLVVFPYRFSFITKVLGRLPFANADPVWKYDHRFDDIDYIYFRRPMNLTYAMRRFLEKVKQKNPRVRIVLEIPTYPYDKEIVENKLNIPLYIKDKYNRKRLNGLVDRLAIIGNCDKTEKVWGIPAIWFVNGVNLKNITCRKNIHHEGEIHVICVSTFEFWHGYDRLFEGLAQYYTQQDRRFDIYIHVVGDGLQRHKYENIVLEKELSNYVKFYGMLYGDELDKVYDKCELACASLGLHRIGVEVGSFLKTREYLAKGMPMLLGCKIDVLDDDYKYSYRFPANDEAIDFNEVINFYKKVYCGNESRQEVIDNIRRFAENTVDLSVTMKEITNYIQGKEDTI